MFRCNAVKKDLHQCSVWMPHDGDRCGTHTRTYARQVAQAGEHQEGMCHVFLNNGTWCAHAARAGELICQVHINQRERLDRQNAEELMIRTTVNIALDRDPRPTWQQFMDDTFANAALTLQQRSMMSRRFFILSTADDQPVRIYYERQNWLIHGRAGPDPSIVPLQPAARQLARIAADSQNVHTALVSEQTNKATEKLLSTPVPAAQSTERQITMAWFALQPPPNFNAYLRVANDMNRWFLQNTCRRENDNLYRRLLRGLVALIDRQEGDVRPELYKRLWEECHEAVGLCCEGHISRLCNVMVGFDEAFQPPVSLGELMQSKMAAIAALDLPVEDRLQQAISWFNDNGVPDTERTGWLEAIAAM